MGTIHQHAAEVTMSLGNRLHAMRESRNWTLERLAESAGLSKAYLSRLEAGERQPSIAALCAIADALGVSVAQLFEHPDVSVNCVIVRGGSVEPREVNGLTYQPLSSSTLPFNLQPIVVTVPHNRAGDETYQHDGEEWLHVTSGRLRLSVGDQQHVLEPGDSAHFDSRLPHRLDPLDGNDVRIVLVACPIPMTLNAKRPMSESTAGQFAG